MVPSALIYRRESFMKFQIEKFYPGPGIEPGPLALRASALTITLTREIDFSLSFNSFKNLRASFITLFMLDHAEMQ